MTQPFTLPEHTVILMLKHIVKMQILDQVQNDNVLPIAQECKVFPTVILM